ncbi:MAG: 4Fe-4S binding protein [Bacteroidetes bacterium]|nr:4Fe-4S binding protein [Bacteroidota bacterium]
MQVTIFYFSGTGNTWWCAQEMKKQLTSANVNCSIISIEQSTLEEVISVSSESDIIGIGYPIYGSDLPQPMKEFINFTLPDNSEGQTKLFTFCTQLIFSGDGAHVYHQELRRKHWEINWSIHLRMPNNVCVTVIPLLYTNDQIKIAKRIIKSKKKIGNFTRAVINGKSYRQGHLYVSKLLGLIQRKPYRKYFPRLQNDITIDSGICISCNRCISICPTENLYTDGDGIKAGGACILCVRCYNFCPTQSIVYMGKKHKEKRGIPYQGPSKDFTPEQIH